MLSLGIGNGSCSWKKGCETNMYYAVEIFVKWGDEPIWTGMIMFKKCVSKRFSRNSLTKFFHLHFKFFPP